MGGRNNFFNQVGSKVGVTLGLMDDPNARLDTGLQGNAVAVQQAVAQTALGQGPSLSSMQYDQALQQSAAAQQAAAASARGVNPALASRQAAMATADAQTQAAQQAAILNEEERRRAQATLLGQYSQQRQERIQAGQQGSERLTKLLSSAGQAMMGGGG